MQEGANHFEVGSNPLVDLIFEPSLCIFDNSMEECKIMYFFLFQQILARFFTNESVTMLSPKSMVFKRTLQNVILFSQLPTLTKCFKHNFTMNGRIITRLTHALNVWFENWVCYVGGGHLVVGSGQINLKQLFSTCGS